MPPEPDDEARHAAQLATSALAAKVHDPADYKLIAAENLVRRGPNFRGPAAWQLVFKPRHTIPSDASGIVGAGGEIVVDVDLAAGTAVIGSYGE